MGMGKQSAGILMYRKAAGREVLLVHPGGPFWARKDAGVWSLPKGEFEEGGGLEAALREFQEELGQPAPEGEYQELGHVKNKSGKVIYAWAVEGNLDVRSIKSNSFTLEWPPKSGKEQEFPEVDRAVWLSLDAARQKLNPAQIAFIQRLEKFLGIPSAAEQTTLL